MINYSPYHRWLKPAVEKPEELYGTKNAKRLINSLPKISKCNITHEIQLLDMNFLKWFTPLYEKTITSKSNAVVHDIFNSTLGNPDKISEYWGLTLFENGVPIGGTILGLRTDRINIVYRIYSHKWTNASLQANPSLYTEYLVSKYAYDLGKTYVSHGKDRNPYGLNANIGLATFKLSVGCTPSISTDNNDYPLMTLDETKLTSDALILNYPTTDVITKATLIATKETAKDYVQLLHYPHLLHVEIIYRN
jgi:hypothetical protein